MSARPHRRLRGVAAVSLAATAGLLGTYLGNHRTPRAYAQPGAPFEAFFSPSGVGIAASGDGPFRDALDRRGGLGSGALRASGDRLEPTNLADCTVTVVNAAGLQEAVNIAFDGDVICITQDIDNLDAPIRVADTTIRITGAAGAAGEDPVTLTAGDNRHFDARFTGEGSLILSNMVLTGGDAGAGQGGAIRFLGPGPAVASSALLIGDVALTDNSAFRGGAIHAQDASVLYVTGGSLLEGNSATNAGGAIYARNVATVAAVYAVMTDNDGGTAGGAIAVEADATDTQVYLAASTVTGNTASAIGGAVAITGEGRNAILIGLGIPDSPLTFARNSAGAGGAVWLQETGAGEAAALLQGTVDVIRNRATTGDGGGFNLSTDGGATTPTLLTLGDDDNGSPAFIRNRAVGDGGAAWVQGAASLGGLYYSVNPTTDLTTVGGTFARNRATNGGAITVEGVVTTLRTAFDRNVATGSGGAINSEETYLTYLTYSSFRGNQAKGGQGGALYVGSDAPGTSVVLSSTLIGNRATDSGGAIAVRGGEHVILNSTLTRNRSGDTGGAVYVGELLETAVAFSTVTANRARQGGGLVALAPQIENSIIQRNRASADRTTADVFAELVNDSYSLFTSESSVTSLLTPGGWTPGSGTVVTSWPVVGAPADNGSPAFPGAKKLLTMAPLNGSPVIDAGTAAGPIMPDNDERGVGYPRVEGAKPEMGAIEWRQQEEIIGLTGARGKGNKANRVTFTGRISGVYVGTVTLTVRIGREAARNVEVRVRDGGVIKWSTRTPARVNAVAKAAGLRSPRASVPAQR